MLRSDDPRLAFSLVLLAAAIALQPAEAPAGPVLDDLLNYPTVDTRCPQGEEYLKGEGLHLAVQNKAKMMMLKRDEPLGQTFTVGDDADELWRIGTAPCHWPDHWGPDEAITFTLWDSAAKKESLYTRTIGFGQKWHKWDIYFDMHQPTAPGTSYYFELTHNGGGDGELPVVYVERDDYPDGCAYVNGEPRKDIDLYFVVITKHVGDRVANLNRLLDRFDLERSEFAEAKKARQAGDLDKAATLVLRAFEKHLKDADFLWKPNETDREHYKPTKADEMADEGRIYRYKEGKHYVGEDGREQWIALNPETNWREIFPHQSRYPSFHDMLRELGWAHAIYGDAKYGAKMDELMADFIQDNVSPFDGGTWGGRWQAMWKAWRLGDAWSGLACATDAKKLSDDVKLGWLDSMDRNAHFAITAYSGGNHANAVAEAVLQFSTRFPLYKAAGERFQKAFAKLTKNSKRLFRDDGACKEPAMNYHGYSLVNLMAGLRTAREFGVTIPDEINEIVEKALSYTAYMLRPDGTIPAYGDTGCEDFRPDKKKWDGWRKGEAMDGYTFFGREDMLYIATAGKKGRRPGKLAYGYPDIGHYVMRSDWGGPDGKDFDQARHLFFRTGRMGSHGHYDMNMVTLYAYGRPLLIDPGRTTYGTPLMEELKQARSHNVLLVEGQHMHHVKGEIQAWQTSPVFDVADSLYTGLYTGVNHRRAVLFIRPDYYVLFDTVTSAQPHKMGINFWMTPPAVTVNRAGQSVHTNEPDGSNVLVQVAAPTGVTITQRDGTVDLDEVRHDIPVVTFWQEGTQAVNFATVLYPYPKGQDAPALTTRTAHEAGRTLVAIEKGPRRDLVYYSLDPGTFRLGDEAYFTARCALARSTAGRVTAFALIDGRRAVVDRQLLATAEKPVANLAVRYEADTIHVDVPNPDPTAGLKVDTQGRAKAVVNGQSVPVKAVNRMFAPFPG